MKFYRFTEESPINQVTIERVSGREYTGVYAWILDPLDLSPHAGDDVFIAKAREYATRMANDSQNGYYSNNSNGNYVVFEGEIICNGNEGVIASVFRVLGWGNIND